MVPICNSSMSTQKPALNSSCFIYCILNKILHFLLYLLTFSIGFRANVKKSCPCNENNSTFFTLFMHFSHRLQRKTGYNNKAAIANYRKQYVVDTQ